MMWPVDGGRLSRKNPAQAELPGLSAVEGGRAEPITDKEKAQ